jgi:hypothetical protein
VHKKDTRTSNVCKVLHFLEPLEYNLARNINITAIRGEGSLTMPYEHGICGSPTIQL